ncbi:MAG: glycosyltransferase family 2 protein [Candidatus Heimdallarchaeota archaeon]|nr:glycosyltransferase family 2 protein [Candidatus Heimdallarchaeota archaeon]
MDYKIGVSIPAYNEEKLIFKTISSVPSFVDVICVVNDKSKDHTLNEINKAISEYPERHIKIIDSKVNGGVGASILKAHEYNFDNGCDYVAVLAGDNQMDPIYLPILLDKLIKNKLGYVKGNRFLSDNRKMPFVRKIGNKIIEFLTSISLGTWNIGDSQNGYTIISRESYYKINLSKLKKRYLFETSLLSQLAILQISISDVPIPAIYGEEKSTISYSDFIPRLSGFLFLLWLQRITSFSKNSKISKLINVLYLIGLFYPILYFLLIGAFSFEIYALSFIFYVILVIFLDRVLTK